MQIPGAGGLRYKERLDVKTYNIGLRFFEEHDLSRSFCFSDVKVET
jgi:hypothetical protein